MIKYIDVETSRSLGDINAKLNDKSKKIIHNSLLDPDARKAFQKKAEQYLKDLPGDQNDKDISAVEFLDYLGALEMSAIMLQRGMISNKEFLKQFGSRYEYIMRSPIINLIKEEKEGAYEPLLYAISVVEKNNKPQKKDAKFNAQTDMADTSTKA